MYEIVLGFGDDQSSEYGITGLPRRQEINLDQELVTQSCCNVIGDNPSPWSNGKFDPL